MKRTKLIFNAIVILTFLPLVHGCATHTAQLVAQANELAAKASQYSMQSETPLASLQEVKTIARNQIEQLAQLGENATKEDVVAILGPPNMDSSAMGGGDPRSAMMQTYGQDFVYQYVDTLPTEYSWGLSGSVTLHYNTGKLVPGQSISGLDVFLMNNRFARYMWNGKDQLLPEASLAEVKPLVGVVRRGQLYESLGPPNRVGSSKLCVYVFQVPAAIAALGVDSLEARWEGTSQDELKFVSIQPGFAWKHEEIDFKKMSSQDRKAMLKSMEQFQERNRKQPGTALSNPRISRSSLVTEYQALLERELRDHGHIETGPWVDRAERVIKRLQPLLSNDFGPIRLAVLQSKAFNACAMRRGRDITVMLYAGLLDHLTNDDELAFVIAHELSHISLGHLYAPTNFLIQYFQGTEVFSPMVSNFYRMSQIDEHGADLLAAQLLGKAGFNASAGLAFLAKAQELNPPPANLRFSTHPEHETRRILLSWYLEFLGLKNAGGAS
jgi:hypothetical protein